MKLPMHLDQTGAKILASELESSRDMKVLGMGEWIEYCGVQLYWVEVESRYRSGWTYYITDWDSARDMAQTFRQYQ